MSAAPGTRSALDTCGDVSRVMPFFWRRGILCALLTLTLAFGLRMFEWPSWQDPEFRLGQEWLLATHDAYHWVAGAEGVGLAVGHPMAIMLGGMADFLRASPASVAFWFPAVLSSLVAVIVFAWAWALGSMEAGIAAGLLTALSPGFLARTLLGFYDTDLVTLFFPLLMTLAPACWAMRYMLLPGVVLRRLAFRRGGGGGDEPLGDPLRWQWVLLLALSGLISWWTQAWHSVFPYLIRYNVLLLAFMALVMAPGRRRALLMLGALAYALPTLTGPAGFVFSLVLPVSAGTSRRRLLHLLCHPATLAALWLLAGWFIMGDGLFDTIANHVNAYLKHAGDARGGGAGPVLVYPSVAQSIIEVQDLSLPVLLSYFHPWPEAAALGLLGFVIVLIRRPGALFLLPLAALALLSTRLGGRMVMFGAPIIGIGLSFLLFWGLQFVPGLRPADRSGSTVRAGAAVSVLIASLLIAPFAGLIPAMSQGPMINRRHAEALTRVRTMTPEDARLWLWWDWGYAAHHFARRATIADGAQHAGPSLYLPAAVFATDNPRFARQLMRYAALRGNEPGNVFAGLDAAGAQGLMERLASPQTPLVEGGGRIFMVLSYEMLRLGFWISNFGSWNFVTRSAKGGALSIVPQSLDYRLETGEVRLEGEESVVNAASIGVFDETGVTRRDYVQEWFEAHPKATPEEQQAFLQGRRNVHFLFNRVTGEKLAVDARIYDSLMVQMLMADPQDPRFSPYFRLVYDNVFARIYEVL